MALFGRKEKKFNPLTIQPPQQDEYEDEISNDFTGQLPNIQPANLPNLNPQVQQPMQPTIQVPTQVYSNYQQPYQQSQPFQQQFQPAYQPTPVIQQPPKEAVILEGAIGEDGFYFKVKTNYPLRIGNCRIENT